jgi:hypothetical protein
LLAIVPTKILVLKAPRVFPGKLEINARGEMVAVEVIFFGLCQNTSLHSHICDIIESGHKPLIGTRLLWWWRNRITGRFGF